MKSLLRLDDLTIGYPAAARPVVPVASHISLTLRPGQLVCLLGPNGAGKSTLMRTLAGMQTPLAGHVFLEEDDVHQLSTRALAKRLSVVLTEKVEGPLLTAYEVVSLGRYPYTNWSGNLTATDHVVIAQSLQQTGATDLAYRTLNELSDGERQRVMLARALAQEPLLMILDEITAFLDLPRRVDTMRLLRDLAHTTGRAILLSTHDLDLALRTADLIWLLPKGGPLTAGAPEDLVLDGSFGQAFNSEGVVFDRRTGSFQVAGGLTQSVQLTGEGESYVWTKRALERRGFTVDPTGRWHIIVQTDGNQPVWTLTGSESPTHCRTIQELMTALLEAPLQN